MVQDDCRRITIGFPLARGWLGRLSNDCFVQGRAVDGPDESFAWLVSGAASRAPNAEVRALSASTSLT
jgi:hypothetical protein